MPSPPPSMPRPPHGSASSIRSSPRTHCARWWPQAPTTRHVEISSRPPLRSCACQDFNRAELLRHAAAQAGRGLPSIEPGMPTPAGTGLSRRGFLLASAGLALSVYGAGRLLDPSKFEEGIALAAEATNAPVLV